MKILITGGLGFIGTNTAIYLKDKGNDVYILDNISRKGNVDNLEHLSKEIDFNMITKDIRNFFDIEEIFKKERFDAVIHLAGQVAVTRSVVNPREDFEINALGTFNILECLRLHSPDTIFIYSSTNKVYGDYATDLVEEDTRYSYSDKNFSINEETPLDFHSPYGCSKGTADQYVRDYHRIYGLNTIVVRQSCIYGPNQFGIEDQGWVSWFSIAAIHEKEFTIYGNGKQVRDVLHVHDLSRLYLNMIENIEICTGEIYNVGGGLENTLSLLELIEIIEKKINRKIDYKYDEWRPGDQKIYISDISKVSKDIGWHPEIKINEGVSMMMDWISENSEKLKKMKIV
jgi:CDP-paratose 2-epimerase